MNGKTHKKRFGRWIALGLAVGAIAAPAALADGRSPDTIDAALSAQSASLDGRSPDTLDAVYSVQGIPLDGRSADTIDAVSTARDGWFSSVADGRSPDTLDAVSTSQSTMVDGRSADTVDSAFVAHEPVVVVESSSFDWGDAGIGFGAAFGIALLALCAGHALRRHGKPGLSIGQPA